MAEELNKKRKNAIRFTEAENLALTEAVKMRHQVLFGKFDGQIDKIKKDKEWQQVLKAVNAVSSVKREKHQIQEKWKNLKKQAKFLASHNKNEIRKTGGGSADIKSVDLCSQNILETMPISCIYGIEGGFDTSDEQSTLMDSNRRKLEANNSENLAGLDTVVGEDKPIISAVSHKLALVTVDTRDSEFKPDSKPTQGTAKELVPLFCVDDLEEVSEEESETIPTTVPSFSNNNDNETPKTTQDSLLSRPNVSRRKKSKEIKNPIEELMARQVVLFEEQVKIMKEISVSLKRRNELEETKLKLKRAKLECRVD